MGLTNIWTIVTFPKLDQILLICLTKYQDVLDLSSVRKNSDFLINGYNTLTLQTTF